MVTGRSWLTTAELGYTVGVLVANRCSAAFQCRRAGLAHLFRTSLMQMLVRMLDATVMSMRMAMRHDCATKAFVDAAELPKGD